MTYQMRSTHQVELIKSSFVILHKGCPQRPHLLSCDYNKTIQVFLSHTPFWESLIQETQRQGPLCFLSSFLIQDGHAKYWMSICSNSSGVKFRGPYLWLKPGRAQPWWLQSCWNIEKIWNTCWGQSFALGVLVESSGWEKQPTPPTFIFAALYFVWKMSELL
jgi:hypothetical protein